MVKCASARRLPGFDTTMIGEHPNDSAGTRQRADDVLAAMHAVVWEVGTDGRVRFVSDSAVSLLGRTLADWYASPERWLEVTHRDDRARVAGALASVTRSGEPVELAARWYAGSGETMHVDLTLTALRDEAGAVVAVRGCAVDATPRRRLEEELGRYRDLVARDRRRTALNSLATALVHEMNQPLTAIMSHAEAARVILGRLPAPHRDLMATLDEIVAGGRRAGDIVGRARGLVTRDRRHWRRVDMNAVVERALALTRTDAALRGARLSSWRATAPLEVQGDPQQLVQVMLNLVGNALDAVGEGGSVDVTLAAVGATSVAVAVGDDGPGIPRELLPRVFDAFLSTKEGNLGLGLDIASAIVRAHRGGMWAANARGGGALVAFALPGARAA